MPSFADDFNRADGSPGADWTTRVGTAAISSGHLGSPGTAAIRRVGFSDSGDLDVLMTMTWSSGIVNTKLWVHEGGANGNSSGFLVTNQGGNLAVAVLQVQSGGYESEVGRYALSSTFNQDYEVRCKVTGTVYSVEIDGVERLSLTPTYRANGGILEWIVFGAGYPINAINVGNYVARTFTITPDPVWVGGGDVLMQATGSGTSWTAGVPGSSTITVDHGTIADQWTEDATTIHFTLQPAEYVGTLTFTESEYGLTDTVNATLDPSAAETSFLCQLEPDAAAYMNRIPHGDIPALLSTDLDLRIPLTTASLLETLQGLWRYLNFQLQGDLGVPPTELPYNPRLDYIWDALNGGTAQPVGIWTPATDPPIKIDTENIRSTVEALTASYDDLADVVGILGGSPVVYSHADLKTAIDLIDWQAILDKLALIQPSELQSISDIITMLSNIQTINGYSLGTVVDRIDALNPSTAPGLAAATASILGAIGALALEVAGVAAAETADAASSAAAAAGVAGIAISIADIISDIANILSDLATIKAGMGSETFHPPVWPGLAHVTMGVPQDIQSGLVVPGPMHGVRVHITSCDPGTSFYDYDVVRNWRNAGALSFCSDVGDQEQFQPLGWQNGVYVPLHMTEAASCKLHLGRGPQGTITPWSYAP